MYDVFAGVGPFSIPAISKRKCLAVLANDLNPNSFRSLSGNYVLNNRSKLKKKDQDERKEYFKKNPPPKLVLDYNSGKFKFDVNQAFVAFNLDGREFIKNKLKCHFIEILNYQLKYKNESKYYVLMNLPAISIEFLDSFKNLYDKNETELIKNHFDETTRKSSVLNIFCYHFCKYTEVDLKELQDKIAKEILEIESLKLNSKFVRKVAPNKDMFCTMFELSLEDLLARDDVTQVQKNKLDDYDAENTPPSKVSKIE